MSLFNLYSPHGRTARRDDRKHRPADERLRSAAFSPVGTLAILAVALLVWMPLSLQAQGHGGHANPAPAAEKPPAVAEEAPRVELSDEQVQRIGVKTVKATVRPIQKIIRTVGRVEIDERSQSTINTKIEGWIEKLHADFTGRYVKKGEALAEIYSPELLATQQEFLNALQWTRRQGASTAPDSHDPKDPAGQPDAAANLNRLLTKDAVATVEAARQRLRLWDMSEAQIRAIEASGKTTRTLTIYSPVSGFITQKMAVEGMRVMPGEKLFDVANLSRLWIVADVYENELQAVRVGQPVNVRLSYFPGRTWSSRIDYISPVFSGETRTAKVRLTLPNPGNQLKPQMFTNVEIRIDMGKKLAIPDSAIIETGRGQVVYVDRGNGAFEPREIHAGLRADGMVEVLRGLRAGDKVASSANFLIDSEAQLKGVKPLSKP